MTVHPPSVQGAEWVGLACAVDVGVQEEQRVGRLVAAHAVAQGGGPDGQALARAVARVDAEALRDLVHEAAVAGQEVLHHARADAEFVADLRSVVGRPVDHDHDVVGVVAQVDGVAQHCRDALFFVSRADDQIASGRAGQANREWHDASEGAGSGSAFSFPIPPYMRHLFCAIICVRSVYSFIIFNDN